MLSGRARSSFALRAPLALLLAAFHVTAGRARADTAESPAAERPRFSWDAPEGCPTSDEVEARIAERVRRPRPRRAVRAFVVKTPSEVRVRVVDGDAERTLVAPTCAMAADAVAVIVAVAWDRDSDRDPEPAAAPEAPETSLVAPPSERSSPVHEREAAASPVNAALYVGAAIDTATLPHAAPGLAVAVEARRGVLAGGLVLGGLLPQTARAGDGRVEASVGLIEAMITGCALVPAGTSFELGGCLGAGAGLMPGESTGITSPRAGVGWRPQGELVGRSGIALSDAIWLRLESGVLVDPIRSPFRVTGVGDVHRPAAASFRASLGVEVRIR